MAFLKLDARHPECHGLARALVGSPSIQMSGHVRLKVDIEPIYGVDEDVFITRDRNGFTWTQQIAIPLDTLKLCPFVAMRERIPLYYRVDNGRYEHTLRFTVTKIKRGDLGASLYARVGGDIFDTHISPSGVLTIDLDNLPKGAEIVDS